ncbi:hypothetical protein TNCV_177251 [Trichonephila clavipes]|nr:hypothetical protein TNCV_177251 [Trichonephila clavipes]
MVSPAVQGQVPHPSIVPEFLRSTSCGMTSARGHGAIVYRLNSGSEDRQTGRHNGEKKDKKTRENGGKKREREETEKERRGEDGREKRRRKRRERVGDGKREEKESGKEREARLVWRKGLSPEIGVERR